MSVDERNVNSHGGGGFGRRGGKVDRIRLHRQLHPLLTADRSIREQSVQASVRRTPLSEP